MGPSLRRHIALIFLVSVPAPGASAQTGDAAKPQAPREINTPLRDELLRRFKEDQDARTEFIAWVKRAKPADLAGAKQTPSPEAKKVVEIDRENTRRMKEIIARYDGWPGKSLVGEKAAHAAWLLVQHADADRAFQKQCLHLMEQAAVKGEVSKVDVAYLTDRVLVAENQKQRYGTQAHQVKGRYEPYPVEDETHVDQRRAEIGLAPLAEYMKQLRQVYQSEPSKVK
jgi:hypothetical protein